MSKSKITWLFIISLIIISVTSSASANDRSWKIYDDTTVGEAKIIIDPAYLDFILDAANAESDSLFHATFIYKNAVIAGDTVFNVGFRLRGNTSRHSSKKSFKVDINHFVPGRQFYDVEKLNFNGEHNDPSIIRSKLCWDLFSKVGVPGSRANFVRLFINDEYRGLYVNVEHIDDEFVQKRFGSENGNLYKCLYPADLVYLGPDQEPYQREHWGRKAYDLKTNKSANDYSDLIHFIDVLNNTPATDFKQEIEKVFHVDNFLKWLAINVLVGSWDDYWYLKNNYYLYHNPATDKFEFIPYDYDNTYGVDWVGGDWGRRNIYNWGHPSESRPLVTRILKVPEYKNRYTKYLSDFMDNEFAFENQEPRIDQLKAMITPAAEADFYRSLDWDFSIDDFHRSFIDSVATVGHHVPYGIKPYIQTRIASARAQLDFVNLPPAFKHVEHFPEHPEPSQPVTITANVVDDGDVRTVRLYFRTPSSPFLSMIMYDDGNHNDGAANDDLFGAQIPPQDDGTVIYYFIESQDNRLSVSRFPATSPENSFFYISRQPGNSDVFVKLHFKKSLPPRDVGVGLLGSFNDWNKIYPMTPRENELWEIPLWLPTGSYIYKFVTYSALNGQAGVTELIADPENPERDGPPYFNAVLNVTDPMIYYLKPMDQDTIFTHRPEITASFASSRNTTINPAAISLQIDSNALCDAENYFDSNSNKFSYMPASALGPGSHSIHFSVQNSQGASLEKSSQFFINSPLLFINEFMGSNDTTIVDNFGEADDWIEIYNGDTKMDVSGYDHTARRVSINLGRW